MMKISKFIALNSFIRKEHPAKKHFLLAHSLGTVICLAVLRKNIHFDGIILSAAFSRNDIEMFLNNLVLWPEYKLSDPKKINSTMEEFTTKKHNSFFKPNRTTHDYISSDNENVDEYIEDDLCGFPMTNQFWMDLKNGCTNLWKKDTYKKFNKKIPFFFITGSFDTVNNMGKQAFDMHQKFLELGFSTKFKAYEKSRHEPLSDVEKETVWKDVSDFFKANL
jgi:alpha-beta hydrolase superfamily lysophospholipase